MMMTLDYGEKVGQASMSVHFVTMLSLSSLFSHIVHFWVAQSKAGEGPS
jgi:hypothetical protein